MVCWKQDRMYWVDRFGSKNSALLHCSQKARLRLVIFPPDHITSWTQSYSWNTNSWIQAQCNIPEACHLRVLVCNKNQNSLLMKANFLMYSVLCVINLGKMPCIHQSGFCRRWWHYICVRSPGSCCLWKSPVSRTLTSSSSLCCPLH